MNGLPSSAPKSERDDDYEEFGSSGGGGNSSKISSHNPSYYNFSSTAAGSSTVSGGNSSSTGSTQNQSSSNMHSSSASSRNQCCLIDDGKRCHRAAGNASYSKRIQKTVYYKRLRLETDHNAQHIYICDYHKMVIQNARTRQKKDSEEDPNEADEIPEVDLYQLQVNTLRRYKKHFKLSSRPGLNKAQLSDILMRHFRSIPVVEKEIVTYFIYTVKSERNKLEQNRHDAPGEFDLY